MVQFFPFLYFDWSKPEIYIGNGPGSYGQESALIAGNTDGSESALAAAGAGGATLGETALHFLDSGLTRIIMELGFLGLLFFFFLMIFVFQSVIKYLFTSKCTLRFGFGWLQVFWIIFFLKAHQFLTDSYMTVFLFFTMGIFLRFRFQDFKL